jgi:hypothetical protein
MHAHRARRPLCGRRRCPAAAAGSRGTRSAAVLSAGRPRTPRASSPLGAPLPTLSPPHRRRGVAAMAGAPPGQLLLLPVELGLEHLDPASHLILGPAAPSLALALALAHGLLLAIVRRRPAGNRRVARRWAHTTVATGVPIAATAAITRRWGRRSDGASPTPGAVDRGRED